MAAWQLRLNLVTMVKRSRLIPVIPLLALIAVPAAASGTSSPDVDQARSIIQSFAKELKGRLTSAMKESGPIHAVSVCKVDAPRIAAGHAAESGWSVGRTSMKVRNPDNAPDAWERRILESFAERAAAGEDLMAIDHLETVDVEGQPTLRYMKAIPMGEVCTTCHGADLDPGLAAKLDELYPEDQARGFQPGELRGAFTLARPAGQ